MPEIDPDKTLPCKCVYCGVFQPVPPPPALHTCVKCGRDFRVFYNVGRTTTMDLTPTAAKFYEKPTRPKRSA